MNVPILICGRRPGHLLEVEFTRELQMIRVMRFFGFLPIRSVLWSVLAAVFLLPVTNAQTMDRKSRELLDKLESRIGSYDRLLEKRDIEVKYVYHSFKNGLNITRERFIYDGEHSWAEYQTHFLPEYDATAGTLRQALIHDQPYASIDGRVLNDAALADNILLHRRVNFYWMTMLYKLRDPGTNFAYLGTHEENGITYDKVHLTFDSDVIDKKRLDQYVLCFNRDTHMVDLYFWSGGTERPLDRLQKTTVEHQMIEGVYIPVLRKVYGFAKDGSYELRTVTSYTEVKFDQGFKPSDFELN
ncbi:hypothetical protein N9K67_03540 [Opitutaceae bacterium]|nr:hypothetical protein [Opitutaceae bacterium]